jgi:hypothetical protein
MNVKTLKIKQLIKIHKFSLTINFDVITINPKFKWLAIQNSFFKIKFYEKIG